MSDTYIPGVCNIGEAEIARRSSKLKISVLLIGILTIAFFLAPYNVFLFSTTAGLACYASILIFQIRQKFCIVFGWISVFNFNKIGDRKNKIENDEWKRMDRIQVIKILVYSILLSFLFSSVIFLLKKIV